MSLTRSGILLRHLDIRVSNELTNEFRIDSVSHQIGDERSTEGVPAVLGTTVLSSRAFDLGLLNQLVQRSAGAFRRAEADFHQVLDGRDIAADLAPGVAGLPLDFAVGLAPAVTAEDIVEPVLLTLGESCGIYRILDIQIARQLRVGNGSILRGVAEQSTSNHLLAHHIDFGLFRGVNPCGLWADELFVVAAFELGRFEFLAEFGMDWGIDHLAGLDCTTGDDTFFQVDLSPPQGAGIADAEPRVGTAGHEVAEEFVRSDKGKDFLKLVVRKGFVLVLHDSTTGTLDYIKRVGERTLFQIRSESLQGTRNRANPVPPRVERQVLNRLVVGIGKLFVHLIDESDLPGGSELGELREDSFLELGLAGTQSLGAEPFLVQSGQLRQFRLHVVPPSLDYDGLFETVGIVKVRVELQHVLGEHLIRLGEASLVGEVAARVSGAEAGRGMSFDLAELHRGLPLSVTAENAVEVALVSPNTLVGVDEERSPVVVLHQSLPFEPNFVSVPDLTGYG